MTVHTNLNCEKYADNRITLLETITVLQSRLQDARDQIHELRRDGDLRVQEVEAQLETERHRVGIWRARHESMARLAAWLLAAICLTTVAAIAGWMR